MATERVKLTKSVVDAARPVTKDAFVWDTEVVGFGLKLAPSGRRTYILQYRHEGRSRRYNIGVHGSPWTVDTARGEARRLVGLVAAGVDPQEEKATAREEVTVAELCDLYLTVGLATRKESSVASAKADINNHIKPLLGARRASLVTPADCNRMLIDIAEGKTARQPKKGKKRGVSRVRGGKGAANAALTTLSAAFGFGILNGVRADNPAKGVRKYPEKKLERFLSPAELARAGEALAAAESLGVESPYAIAALRVLMLSGCRKNEVLTAKRPYVDAHNHCLRLPDSKTGAKVVHLGEAAMEVILALPEVVGNEHLFPGRGGEGHLVDLQSPWERIRGVAGLTDVRIHDLRHAFASIGAAGGDSLLIIGALLGHKSAKTTQRYAHLADHPLKEAANRISAQVAAQMGLKRERAPKAQRAQVVPAPLGTESVLGRVIETKWLDTPEAAEVLGSTVGTLQTWRWMGVGPAYRKIGRRVVYALGDLQAWASARASEAVAA